MKRLFFALFILLTSCTTTPSRATYTRHERVRVTFYHRFESGGKGTASGVAPKEGVTVAAHPKWKFRTSIFFPSLVHRVGNGYLIVQDRGPAVTNRVASHGRRDVFDVYLNCSSAREGRRRVAELERQIGHYAEVYYN